MVIQAIISVDQINLGDDWIPVDDFKSKGTIVRDSEGYRYQILEKRIQYYPTCKRFIRVMGAILAVVSTLFLALLAKPIRKLLFKQGETIRFAIQLNENPDSLNLHLQSAINEQNKANADYQIAKNKDLEERIKKQYDWKEQMDKQDEIEFNNELERINNAKYPEGTKGELLKSTRLSSAKRSYENNIQARARTVETYVENLRRIL
jgi:hypothetical protein